MSHLEELIDGASGDEPVTNLLRKVKVVAARADVPALDEWVDHELDGYPSVAELPAYRGPFEAEVLATLGGPFGSGFKNAPVPSVAFPEEYRDALFQIRFHQPIAELEGLIEGENQLESPWPANDVAFVNNLIDQGHVQLEGHLVVQQARRVVTRPQIAAIVDAVRNRILDLALTMEKSYPEAGQPDGPTLDAADRQSIVTNIYGNPANVAVGSTEVTQIANINAGDKSALGKLLADVGVPGAEIEKLFQALDADGDSAEEMGPETTRWYTTLMSRATELGIGSAGGVIAQAVTNYLGIG